MNIYVSNVSFQTSEADLKGLFDEFGAVSSVKLIVDKSSGKSRGFGFVEMPSEEEGNKAIAGLDNKEVGGRPLAVTVARDKGSNTNN